MGWGILHAVFHCLWHLKSGILNGEFIINGNAGIKEAPHVFYDWNENVQRLHDEIITSDIVILDSYHAKNEVVTEITQILTFTGFY